ncbi:MAG: hypothetical protein ACXADW_04900 [Candidatus Hodarchaeales archaeon]
MIIREFLIIHESGTVLFHRKYQTGNSTDIILRSGLISALYNYATEVEDDAIDILQMSKVSLFFKKREQPLLFVFFIESDVNPLWCEEEINILIERFFQKFPEVIWKREILDLSTFYSFDEDADEILLALGKKIDLLVFLIEDGFITEEEYLQEELPSLGRKVGMRSIEKYHNAFKDSLEKGENFVLALIDRLISQLNGDNIKREDKNYIIDCGQCFFQVCEKDQCFFEEFLHSILFFFSLTEPKVNRITD